MEVVGFIAAVGSIGHGAYKFGTKIAKVAKEAGTVSRRIERASLVFITFGTTITMAESSLEHRFPHLADSRVASYMREKNLLENMKRFSHMIQQDIRIREQEIGRVASPFSFVMSWKWDRLEQRILSMIPLMECLKTNLHMTLAILNLEALAQMNEARPSKDYEKEIEFLKMQIVEHIGTIRHLKRSNRELLRLMSPQASEDSDGQSLPPEADQLRVLCHLGQSLVERGTVPTQPPEMFSFKSARRLRRDMQKESAAEKRRRNSTPLTINTADHGHSTGPGSSIGSSPNHRVSPTNPQDSGKIARGTAKRVNQTYTRPEPTPPASPTSPDHLPNKSSRPSFQRILPIEKGNITHRTGERVDFEAHIDRQLAPQNYITLEYATELGVIIQRHPARILVYRGVEIEAVGKVILNLETLPGAKPVDPSTVEVTVCRDLPGYRCIFGEW